MKDEQVLKIDRTSWILIALVGTLLVILWAVFNRPYMVPKWPTTIQGVTFSPFRAGQSPKTTEFPSEAQITRDLQLLSDRTRSIRTYTIIDTLGSIPRLARAVGLDVTVGIWISGDVERNRKEIQRLRDLVPEFGGNVKSIVVGNEVLERAELKSDELAAYVDEVRAIVAPIPVTVAETWHNWIKHPELAEHVDFITAHVLPYWEGIPAKNAHDYVFERYNDLRRTFQGQEVVLGEVGWPSEGRQRGGAIPSMQNQAKFLRRFLQQADARGTQYFVLEAFDQIWKTDEGAVGRYWGIYNAQREAKFPFSAPVTPVPEWPAIVGFSLAFTILILTLLLRDSRGLVHGGRGFLVLVSYAISTVVVWLVYDYSKKYLTWEQVIVGIGLLTAAFCISIVLLAEAHEWAEAIWNRKIDRTRKINKSNGRMRKVSIHVPIYNEPPDMVIETLSALRKLDHPDYEIIVVDNNTSDPAIWRPVEDWCNHQEEDFHFYHVDPLDGFKAGALNYALEKTAPDADLIAVIDSDYIVSPNWLADCTPMFDDDNVSIVQAPQDYRDAGESLFKSMIYCEYAGFFGIGMVNRDARNAIIQHGTMTIVRRTALKTVNGWSEWCITEDAELGLKILADGHRASYIPKSYGRGLMPDNFMDYKQQRFRWAYGSVLILRHHFRYFLGLEKSKLTSGQRYHFVAGWLPWMADGLSLGFNCIALGYSVMMVMFPLVLTPPEVMLSLLPIGFFVFKLSKMLVLYRWRMKATLTQSLAAGIAGLAVAHTVSRAMLAGLRTTSIGFIRTPKYASSHSFVRALSDAREEALLGSAMLIAAAAIAMRDDAYLSDTKFWIALLCIQSIPYLSAVLLSLISAYRGLPANLVVKNQDDLLLSHLPETASGRI
ncbi:MAG: glycosyltransferase [Granulosicoccus sp.]